MIKRRRFTKQVALATSLGVCSIAGCSQNDSGSGNGGGGSGAAEIDYEGPIPDEIIRNAQEAGGTATIVGGTGESNLADMTGGLAEQFSFGSAEYSQLSDSNITSRLTSERETDNVSIDGLFSGGLGAQTTLVNQTDTLRQIPDSLVGMFEEVGYPENGYGDFYYPNHTFPIVLYYNTDRISEDELPDSYLGMTQDRFDGEVVTESPTTLGGMDAFFATLRETWGDDQFEQWAEGLIENNLQETDSGGQAYTEVANGNNILGFGLIDDLIRARRNDTDPGVDIAWSMMNPHGVELQFPGGLVAESPNPEMAELFAAYAASPEGQRIMADWGIPPVLTEIKQEVFSSIIPSDYGFETGVFNVDDYYDQTQEYADYYEELGFGI